MKRSIYDLNLIDDFLFAEASTDKHGIRMDVTIKEIDENGSTVQLFDVEPNNISDVNLPRRSRYYQALTDVKLLDAGVQYDRLPDMWTIWILPYDPFGLDYMLYSVKNTVENSPELEYDDGVRKLFLYTGGTKGGSVELKNLLSYIQNSVAEKAVDVDLNLLHNNVVRLKCKREIGVKYMQMQELMEYTAKKATKETQQRMAKLIKDLLAAGNIDDLNRIAEDSEYLETLLDSE